MSQEDSKAAAIVKHLSSKRSLRMPHEPVWAECYEFTAPERGVGLNGDESYDAATEQAKRARILTSVPADSAENLSANLVSGIVPSNSRWFDMAVDGADETGKRWLSDAADTLFTNIHAANFDAEVYDGMQDIVDAGWFVLYIDENREKGGLWFEVWPLAQCFIDSSTPGGRVDIIYRRFKLTAAQAVATYTKRGDKLSQKLRDAARDKPDTMFEFCTSIEPNNMHVVGAVLAKNLPFSSTTVEVAEKTTVRESGYHEFPCAVPRWSRIPGSAYATGPVAKAMPDIRMLNKLRYNEAMATDLAVSGMWIAEDDGVLNPKTIKVGPRKIIVANSVDSMKPLLTGADFKVAWTKADDLERQIRKKLMADQLQPQDGPAMTATEVHVRVSLIRQLLGPVFGRMQAEFLQPMIERCFGLVFRVGRPELGGSAGPKLLPDPPQPLAGQAFHIKYISPMARSQKLEEVTAVERYAMYVEARVAAGAADARDLIDIDEASRVVGDGLGVPQRIIPDKRKVSAIRDARAQDQQQQQQQMQRAEAQQSMTDAMSRRMAAA